MSRAVHLSDLPASVRAKLKLTKQTKTENLKRLEALQAKARQDTFFAVLRRAKLPMPETEFQFDAKRKWRIDYAWQAQKIALEVEGGAWTHGRHTTGAGFVRDMEKYNALTLAGWKLFRTTPDKLSSLTMETLLRRALKPSIANEIP